MVKYHPRSYVLKENLSKSEAGLSLCVGASEEPGWIYLDLEAFTQEGT